MFIDVNGAPVFAANGGVAFDPARPPAVFLHGSGMDHSAWALQTRWFAAHGFGVLAVDLPGHGKSGGGLLTSIAAMADWVADLLDAAGVAKALVIGHSMGSLIALETGARHPSRVAGLGLVATAPAMPVHPDLLAAAERNDPAAHAMVNLWGHGARAGVGGCKAPGLWMTGQGARVLANAPKGALFADMSACDAYADGLAAAAKISAPTAVVLGGRDMMTPAAQGRALAKAIQGAVVAEAPAAGHMLPIEEPDHTLDALIKLTRLYA